MASKEEQLAQAFPTGGEAELEQALEIYGQALLQYCYSILCNYHDAQEATLTAFYKAHMNRKKFTPGTSLQAWLWRIAYRTCIDIIRKEKLRRALPLDGLLREPSCDDLEDHSILRQSVLEAMAALTPRERALVHGRVYEGRSYAELQSVLGGTQAALRKQFERAKDKLAEHLREYEGRENGR